MQGSEMLGMKADEWGNGAGGGGAHDELEEDVVYEGADPVAADAWDKTKKIKKMKKCEASGAQRCKRARARDARSVCESRHLQLMSRALFPVSHERPDHERTGGSESDAPIVGSWRGR